MQSMQVGLMRTLHFDCFSGISGDMTVAALVSAGASRANLESAIASLGLPIRLEFEATQRGSFAALALAVSGPPPEEQPHRHLKDILVLLERGELSSQARQMAVDIFQAIGVAEAKVHGVSLDEIHFHEVGALDSIADIVGAAVCYQDLRLEHCSSRSVPTGSGTVKAAHGQMPIPAPATAELLRGVPLAASTIKSELTTPTGAAILKVLVKEWTETPTLRIDAIGYGAGQKDFPQQANLLRVLVGTKDTVAGQADEIWEVRCNLDDVSPEIVGYCLERCLAAGAVDAFAQPIQMKKGRPGLLLTALVEEPHRLAVEQVIFQETGTFGLRRQRLQRSKLQREPRTIQTKWGPLPAKMGWQEGQPPLLTPEYEGCAKLARETGIPLRHIYEEVQRAWAESAH